MPPTIRDSLNRQADLKNLIEVVMDLGRQPEGRFPSRAIYLSEQSIAREDLDYVRHRVGASPQATRAGIERTLHRISAIRNRREIIVGLTCRVGRAVFGTVDILRDVVESGKSVLLLGRPGVGKTTLLRESARVLSTELTKRVIVVDTSNEIAGDGDIPHPGIGTSRRMQVPRPELQHAVMIEAVENHMPEVIVIDEIGTEAEALAARTIAERGVQLIATAHGNSIDNLLMNPTLADLLGGIHPVTLSDEEARRRGTQKTVLERKAPPTFDTLVEIRNREEFSVYHDTVSVVDAFLRGRSTRPEVRIRKAEGFEVVEEVVPPVLTAAAPVDEPRKKRARERGVEEPATGRKTVRIYPYGVSKDRVMSYGKPVELAPQSAHIRRLQHQLIEQHGLGSESRGEVPWRRVIVLPTRG